MILALLHKATGLGKTTTGVMEAVSFLQTYEQQRGYAEPPRFLWLAHTLKLVSQARERFELLLPGATTNELTGKQRDFESPAQFTFATLQTMQAFRRNFSPRTFKHVTVDESHHGPADTFGETILYFDPDFLLGVTATPYRADDRRLKDIFGEVTYSMPLARGMVEGWLAPLDYRLQSDRIVRQLQKKDFRSISALNRALVSPKRNEAIAKIIIRTQKEVGKSARTILFCNDKNHVDQMTRLIPGSEPIYSGLRDEVIDDRWERLKTGELKTAGTVNMATEGVDIPELNIGVLLNGTELMGKFEQQIGRLLRTAKGKEKAIILDFAANSERVFALHRLMQEIKDEYRKYHKTFAQPGQPSDQLSEEAVEKYVKGMMGFAFTEVQVDVIKRLEDLINAPAPPKGWRDTDKLSKVLGIQRSTIRGILRDLRIEGAIMRRPNGQARLYYSPLEQGYIALALKYNRNFESWYRVFEIAREAKVSVNSAQTELKRLDITPQRRLIGSPFKLVSPEDAAMAIEALESRFEIGAMAVRGIARVAEVNAYQVKKVIKELGVEGEVIGSNSRGDVVQYAPDDVHRILDRLSEKKVHLDRAPDGYTPYSHAKSRVPQFDDVLEKSGFAPYNFLNHRGQPARYFSPEQMSTLLGEQSPPPAGYLSRVEVAEALGTTVEVVARLEAKNELVVDKFTGANSKQPVYYLSPAQLSVIAADPFLTTPPPPEGYKIATQIAIALRVRKEKVDQAASELGIETQTFKTVLRPRLLEHYSPDDVERITKHLGM